MTLGRISPFRKGLLVVHILSTSPLPVTYLCVIAMIPNDINPWIVFVLVKLLPFFGSG